VLTDRKVAFAVAGLAVVALILRLIAARQSVVGDELFLYEIVHGHGLSDAVRLVHDTESTPPFHFILAWLSSHAGGGGLGWIRLPSVVLSSATVPLIYLLGARTAGRGAGLVGAALFAIVPFDVFYGVEGRAYATVAFLSAASTLSLLALVRTGRRRWVAALALTTTAAMYTHYTAVFALAAGLVWAFWACPGTRRKVLLAYGVAVLAYVPWVPSFFFQSHDSAADRIKVLFPLDFGSFGDGLSRAWLGHPSTTVGHIPGVLGSFLIVLGLAVGAFALFSRRARATPPTLRHGPTLLLVLALATPVGALLYSLGPKSIFLPRNMSASIPGALLLTAALVTAPRRRGVAILASAALLAGVAVGTARSTQRAYQRPDYQGIGRYLDRNARAADAILEVSVVKGPIGRQLSYYLHRPHHYETGLSAGSAVAQGHRSGRLYIVSLAQATQLLGLLNVPARGFRLVATRTFPGAPPLVLLTYESTRRR
jgi:4-amino-4-deoxy-L-arabinose transferase-like glycosyltransferase